MSNTATTVVTVTRVAEEDSSITSPPAPFDILPQTNDPLSMIIWALIGIGIAGLTIALLASFMLTKRSSQTHKNRHSLHPSRTQSYVTSAYSTLTHVQHTCDVHALPVAIIAGTAVAAIIMLLVLII